MAGRGRQLLLGAVFVLALVLSALVLQDPAAPDAGVAPAPAAASCGRGAAAGATAPASGEAALATEPPAGSAPSLAPVAPPPCTPSPESAIKEAMVDVLGLGQLADQDLEANFAAYRAQLGDMLAASADPDHLLTAALLAGDDGERMALLDRAVAIDPGNPIYRYQQLLACLRVGGCAQAPALESALVQAAPDNGAAHALVGANCLRRGADACLAQALDASAKSPEYTQYRAEVILRVEQSLRTTPMPFGLRALFAVGVSASGKDPTNAELTALCSGERPVDLPDATLADVCLAYGELLARSGSYLVQRTGLQLQMRLREALADTAGVQQLALALEQLDGEGDQLAQLGDALERRMVQDEALFHGFMARWASDGEAAAMKWVRPLLENAPDFCAQDAGEDAAARR